MEIQRGSDVKDFHELKAWQKAHELTLAAIGSPPIFHAQNSMD
jgi:hypothetical protein